MKKTFLLLIGACFMLNNQVQAQELENSDIVVLSKVTLDSLASVATSNQTYYFSSNCKGITMSMAGRDPRLIVRQNFSTGLNFKNNTAYTINLPVGVSMYGIQFAGHSYGDNWTYLYAYGPSASEWEFTDPIGDGVKDNNTIITKAKYPMDPCVTTKDGVPVYHNAGYTFASISFGNDPYEGTFTFRFTGNNQEQALIRVFTTKSAWDTYSAQCAAIDYGGSTGIENVTGEAQEGLHDNVMYNIAGQRITTAKGLYIMNGKKYVGR